MRNRIEIEKAWKSRQDDELTLEILLDIRDILNSRKENKCANCEETKVEHKGDWCDECNLPEKDDLK